MGLIEVMFFPAGVRLVYLQLLYRHAFTHNQLKGDGIIPVQTNSQSQLGLSRKMQLQKVAYCALYCMWVFPLCAISVTIDVFPPLYLLYIYRLINSLYVKNTAMSL